jgi:N-acyl-D-aspartate/D-glutamate deacylase
VASSGGLRARLPKWAQAGGRAEVLARLRDPDTRTRLRYEIDEGMAHDGVSMRIYRWEDVLVGMSPSHPDYVGLTLAQVAEREGKAPSEAMLDLLLADQLATRGIYFHMSEADVRRIMRDPLVAIGSDGLYMGLPDRPDQTNPHPRHYGTFARVLGHYTRDEKVLELPEAIRKMTSLSAKVLGLHDRGLIAPGYVADLVVFDPAEIADHATFEQPHQEPAGIRTVLVNGIAVIRDGRPSGDTPGRVLRHRNTGTA